MTVPIIIYDIAIGPYKPILSRQFTAEKHAVMQPGKCIRKKHAYPLPAIEKNNYKLFEKISPITCLQSVYYIHSVCIT